MTWIWILLNECLQRDMLAALISPWEKWLGYTACLHATCKQTWLLAVLAPLAHDPRRPCFSVTHCLLKSVGLIYWVTYLPYLAKCGFLYSHCFSVIHWWVCIELYWCCGTVIFYYMLGSTSREKYTTLCFCQGLFILLPFCGGAYSENGTVMFNGKWPMWPQ